MPTFAAVDAAPTGWAAELRREELAGVGLGVVPRPFFEACSPGVTEGVQAALVELERAGVELIDLALPEAEPAFKLWCQGHLSAPEA